MPFMSGQGIQLLVPTDASVHEVRKAIVTMQVWLSQDAHVKTIVKIWPKQMPGSSALALPHLVEMHWPSLA